MQVSCWKIIFLSSDEIVRINFHLIKRAVHLAANSLTRDVLVSQGYSRSIVYNHLNPFNHNTIKLTF